MRIAVFASGNGSNFQALIDAARAGKLNGEVALLVCDQPDAFVVKRAERAGVPSFVFSSKDYKNKAQFENRIVQELQRFEVNFIVLAGYMRLIGPTLLTQIPRKIVNIHPSLLPSFPGLDAVGQALQAGVKVSGVTIHYVDEGMDTGEIIAQQAVPIFEDDDHETLHKRIHAVEHKLYPKIIQKIIESEKKEEC